MHRCFKNLKLLTCAYKIYLSFSFKRKKNVEQFTYIRFCNLNFSGDANSSAFLLYAFNDDYSRSSFEKFFVKIFANISHLTCMFSMKVFYIVFLRNAFVVFFTKIMVLNISVKRCLFK